MMIMFTHVNRSVKSGGALVNCKVSPLLFKLQGPVVQRWVSANLRGVNVGGVGVGVVHPPREMIQSVSN